jgi:hypothetical protein
MKAPFDVSFGFFWFHSVYGDLGSGKSNRDSQQLAEKPGGEVAFLGFLIERAC